MHFKGSHKDVARICRELGVDYVVEGSSRSAEGRMVLTVHLIRFGDQTHLSAKRYDSELHDVLNTVSEATQTIAKEIGVPPVADKLRRGMDAGRRVSRKPTENFTAYNLFLQGRYYLNKQTPEGIARAKQCFEEAIAQAPEFTLAHNAMGKLYWDVGFYGIMLPKEAFTAGVWSTLRAIEIDNTLAEAHA